MNKKVIVLTIVIFSSVMLGYIIKYPELGVTMAKPALNEYVVQMKRDLLCIMLAYPESVSEIEASEDGKVYVVLKSGKKLLYDDKRTKSMEEKLSVPDLQDMLEQIYPLQTTRVLMDKSFDPGRSRVYGLLYETYGSSKASVEANLTNVKTGYKSFQFNQNNEAAEALEKVMKELVPLAEAREDIRRDVFPCSGTYNYRVISGTDRLSPHSFGIAIDLARDDRDYWKWATAEEGQKRLSKYPIEIVEIFEKNNFIWGGKWGHFDILHFEYRPEIILKARFFGASTVRSKVWYEGAPQNDKSIKSFIEIIDTALPY